MWMLDKLWDQDESCLSKLPARQPLLRSRLHALVGEHPHNAVNGCSEDTAAPSHRAACKTKQTVHPLAHTTRAARRRPSCPRAPCVVLLRLTMSCTPSQASLAALVVTGIANRILYKMALVPLGNYVFFLAQFQTFGYVAVYFAVLALRRRCAAAPSQLVAAIRRTRQPAVLLHFACAARV